MQATSPLVPNWGPNSKRNTADFVADTDATGSSEHPKRPIAVDFRKVAFWIVAGMAGFEWRVGVSCCWFRLTDDGGSRPTSGHIRRYESCLKAAASRQRESV